MKRRMYLVCISILIVFSTSYAKADELDAELISWGSEITEEVSAENESTVTHQTIGANLDPYITVRVESTGLYWEIRSPGTHKRLGTKIDVVGNALFDVYFQGAGNLVKGLPLPTNPILEVRYGWNQDRENPPADEEFKNVSYLSTFPLVENQDASGGRTYYLWGEVTAEENDPATVNVISTPPGRYKDLLGFYMTFVAHL